MYVYYTVLCKILVWKTLQAEGTCIDTKMQMIVPESLKEEILELYHDVPTAGHLGIYKTLEKIKQHLYWPSMKNYVTKYCNFCDSCAARKPSRSRNKAPLGKYVVGAPLEGYV